MVSPLSFTTRLRVREVKNGKWMDKRGRKLVSGVEMG